jgi:hypothetical protein
MRHSSVVPKLPAVIRSRTKLDPNILMLHLADKFYSKRRTKIIDTQIKHLKQ